MTGRRPTLITLKKRQPPKHIERKEIGQDSVGYMDKNIYQVVPDGVNFSQSVIDRKRKIHNGTGRIDKRFE